MRRLFVIAVGMTLALLPVTTATTASAGTASAGTAQGWTAPKKAADYARDVEMAANRRGDLVVVWQDKNGLLSRFKPAGRRWGQIQRVARGGFLLDDALSLDDKGRATLVWHDPEGLQVSDRRRGTWHRDRKAPLVHRDREGCGDESIQGNAVVATDATGSVFVSWYELGCSEGYSWFRQYASRRTDGTWSRLYDGGGDDEHHAAVFPRPGRVLVLNATSGITVQSGWAGDRLGRERKVGPPGSYHGLDVDLNRRGDLLVVARPFSGGTVTITRPAGDSWSTARHTPVPQTVSLADVDLTDTGLFVMTYLRKARGTTLLARTGHVRDDLLSPPEVIARGVRGAVAPSLAARGDGSAAVVWTRSNWPDTLSTHAAVRSASGQWSTPVRLAPRRTVDNDASAGPEVLATRGGFTAAFVRNGVLVNRFRLH